MNIETLKEYGANVEEGLNRCFNDGNFYLMLVSEALKDERILSLESLIKDKKLEEAFELAHALKGMYGNLSITPLYLALSDIVEPLRRHEDIDYQEMLNKLVNAFNKFQELK